MARNFEEKRAYRRLNVYILAKYRLLSAQDKTSAIGYIKNISGGGVCLQMDEPLPQSSVVQLYINFPQLPNPIPTLAQIVWIKKVKMQKRYYAGVQFLNIEQIFRDAIIKRVELVGALDNKEKDQKSG